MPFPNVACGRFLKVREYRRWSTGGNSVFPTQKYTAVSPILIHAGKIHREFPLHVELEIAESPFSFDVSDAAGFVHHKHAVANDPFRRRLVFRLHPFVQVLTVEENDRIRGGRGTVSSGRHDFRRRLTDLRFFRITAAPLFARGPFAQWSGDPTAVRTRPSACRVRRVSKVSCRDLYGAAVRANAPKVSSCAPCRRPGCGSRQPRRTCRSWRPSQVRWTNETLRRK